MADAAHELRDYLRERGGRTEAPVSKLVGPWDADSRATYAARITAELEEVGILIDPPLAECEPDTVIHLWLSELEVPDEPAAVAVVTPAVVDEPVLEDPAHARADTMLEGRPTGSTAGSRVPPVLRTRRGAAAAAACVALLLLVVVMIGPGGSDDGEDRSSSGLSGPDTEQTRFCDSKAGRALTDAEYLALERPEDLARATVLVMRGARSAPDGADCAVLALNTLADRWAETADRERARTEVRRIRAFQRQAQLLRPSI